MLPILLQNLPYPREFLPRPLPKALGHSDLLLVDVVDLLCL